MPKNASRNLDQPCPRCGQPPGAPCLNARGQRKAPCRISPLHPSAIPPSNGHADHPLPPPPPPHRSPAETLGRIASTILPMSATRFAEDLFPSAALSLVVGQPSAGKSTLGAWLTRHVARTIILPGSEESISSHLIPRLRAADSPLDRVMIADTRTWTFPVDRDRLGGLIARWEAKLVWIDPIDGYIGDANENDGQAVRAVLESLAHLAEEHQCAIVAARHPGKARDNPCPGSRQWRAVPREVIQLTIDTGPPLRRFLSRLKPLSGPGSQPREYALVGDPGEPPRFSLGPIVSEGEVDLCYLSDRVDRWRIDQAETLLRGLLGDGPVPSKVVYAHGETERIGDRIMRRAAERLGVVIRREGLGLSHYSTWELPGNPTPATPDATQGHTPCPDSEGVSPSHVQSSRSGKSRRRKGVPDGQTAAN